MHYYSPGWFAILLSSFDKTIFKQFNAAKSSQSTSGLLEVTGYKKVERMIRTTQEMKLLQISSIFRANDVKFNELRRLYFYLSSVRGGDDVSNRFDPMSESRKRTKLSKLNDLCNSNRDIPDVNFSQFIKTPKSNTTITEGKVPKRLFPLRRGTRTTGAGASNRRNPSIFSNERVKSSSYLRRTSMLFSGDMSNKITKCNSILDPNPMMGKLWAKITNAGTLLIRLQSTENEQPIIIELTENVYSCNETSSHSLSLSYQKMQDEKEKSISSPKTICAQFFNDSDQLDPSSFIPVEGIWGVYDLPCSGPHAVLITESEKIYDAPLTQSHLPDSFPLLELRRIKSLEIVRLRSKMFHSHQNKMQDYEIEQQSEGQLAEEARQLRFLRNAFKDHDFYFTVPRCSEARKSNLVVQDVTQTLQRSYLKTALNRDLQSECSNGNFRKATKNNRWWTPYLEKQTEKNERRHTIDSRFFWNEEPALAFMRPLMHSFTNAEADLQSPYALLLDNVIPVVSAFVGVEHDVQFPSTVLPSKLSFRSNESYDELVISRRSKYRTGTRFTRRGLDDSGAVANYVETEQICFIKSSCNDKRICDETQSVLLAAYSHVQTRGSIPLHWSSPADVKAYRPKVYIGVDPMAQARGLRDHLLKEVWCYSSPAAKIASTEDNADVKLAIVNLIDKHGDQGRLGNLLDSVLSTVLDTYSLMPLYRKYEEKTEAIPILGPNYIKHIWFDFHAECKGGRWDRLGKLLDKVVPIILKQSYFCAVSNEDSFVWEIINLQNGVIRTNCMDCLDRTNVVQSIFARFVLFQQLYERAGFLSSIDKYGKSKTTQPLEYDIGYKHRPLTLPWTAGEAAHRSLWAENADAISRLYAGTPALKGDFTRTGKRTKRGALDDGLNSLQRFYLNNFIDADRQEGMDLMIGSSTFNVIPLEQVDRNRIHFIQEHAENNRRGYNKSHVRLKVKNPCDNRRGDNSIQKSHIRYREIFRSRLLRSSSNDSRTAFGFIEEEKAEAEQGSDFLLKVSSYEMQPVRRFIDDTTATVTPWWLNRDASGYEASLALCTPKFRALVASMLLLLKAPVYTAIMTVVILSGGIAGLTTDGKMQNFK